MLRVMLPSEMAGIAKVERSRMESLMDAAGSKGITTG